MQKNIIKKIEEEYPDMTQRFQELQAEQYLLF